MILPLEKTRPTYTNPVNQAHSGCCGGAPLENKDACCQLDEVKKAEGEAGCGCGTSTTTETTQSKSSCC